MTEDEYLTSKGYENPFYSVPTTHKGNLRTQHQQNLLSSISITRSNKYEAERNVLKEEYRAMLGRGEIRQPTKTERIIKAAMGILTWKVPRQQGVWLWQWALTGNLRKTVCR